MIDLFCIASGPSLTVEDCEIVKNSGIKSIAVNNSWEIAPFCYYIYAGDTKWWKLNMSKINVKAEKWTCSTSAANTYGINFHFAGGSYNSGMRAIQFGMSQGFKNIALLGYDCSLINGIHWHGAHTNKSLDNPTKDKLPKWKSHFKRVAESAAKQNVKIINCSRYTELDCFDIVSLESALGIT